jgi:hypothetical protein
MLRVLPALLPCGLIALVLANPATADPPDKAAKQPANPAGSPQIIALSVSTTPAPVPTLRYELLPPARSRLPGNAAVDYLRAVNLLPPWPRDAAEGQNLHDDIDRWSGASLDEFPAAEVAAFLKKYEPMFAAFDRAVRYERCDWQLGPYLSPDQLDGLLTESQKYRELVRYYSLRLKAHLAGNKFDDATGDLQAGFRLAKDVAESPTTIRMLIGIALAAIATRGAEEWVGRPDAPNLYWALASLPHPFIDPRPALEGELAFVRSSLTDPEELTRGVLPASRALDILDGMLAALHRSGKSEARAGGLAELFRKAQLAEYAERAALLARAQLITMGRPADEVAEMPAAQAVALRSVLVPRSLWDDQVKCFRLPHARAVAELKKVTDRAAALKATDDPFLAVYSMHPAAMEKVYYAYIRVGRRLAGLQAVEAVRLHLAANAGKMPGKLADVTAVPVPDDPLTGKPFEYAATPDGFTLSAPPPEGDTPHAGNSFRYEVKVRKR